MKNKAIIFCFLLVSIATYTTGQVKIEAQLGGSNFLGISLNTAYEIPLSKNGNHFLVPSIGLGFLAPQFYNATSIIHTGLNYRYKNWGIGSEVAGFTGNPYSNKPYVRDFVDMLVYPNINYTFEHKSNWYCKISAGAYLAYSRYYYDYRIDDKRMQHEGDVIPGGGISIGYRFNNPKEVYKQ